MANLIFGMLASILQAVITKYGDDLMDMFTKEVRRYLDLLFRYVEHLVLPVTGE